MQLEKQKWKNILFYYFFSKFEFDLKFMKQHSLSLTKYPALHNWRGVECVYYWKLTSKNYFVLKSKRVPLYEKCRLTTLYKIDLLFQLVYCLTNMEHAYFRQNNQKQSNQWTTWMAIQSLLSLKEIGHLIHGRKHKWMSLGWDTVLVLCEIFLNINIWKHQRAPAFDTVINIKDFAHQ